MRLSSLHISILKLMQVVYFSWVLHLPTCPQIYDIFRNEHRIGLFESNSCYWALHFLRLGSSQAI